MRETPADRVADEDPVAELHGRLRLSDVRFARLAAEAEADPPFTVASVSISVAPPEVLVEPPRFATKFMERVALVGDDDAQVAWVEVVVVLEFELADGDVPSADAISGYVRRNATFIAHPYIREAVHSLSSRLGTDAILLGVLDRSQVRPDEVRFLARGSTATGM